MLLAKTYLQKSNVILYPLLQIPITARYKPEVTYISSKKYSTDDCVLICIYKSEATPEFYDFRNKELCAHPLYLEHQVKIGENIIVFNLKNDYQKDFALFLDGKYSKISSKTKKEITKYYSSNELGSVLLDTHLHPEAYHEYYANCFNVSVELIKNNFETLSPPDLEKEKLN